MRQENKWIDAICSENFDPGKAISDLTGHEYIEVAKPDRADLTAEQQLSVEAWEEDKQ